MGVENEFMECVGDLIDPHYKIQYTRNDTPPPVSHFSEYQLKTQKLPTELLEWFNDHMRTPTKEEYEQYAIKQAEEQERIKRAIEERSRFGPAFLSDEWYANLPDHVVYARCSRY